MFGIKKLEEKIEDFKKETRDNLGRGSEIMTKHSEKIAEVIQNSKQYCECSVCGCLVNKKKAEVEWEMQDKTISRFYGFPTFGMKFSTGAKEAVKTYKCLHCQSKKSKK